MSVTITEIKYEDDYTGLQSGNGADTGVTALMGYPMDFIYAVGKFYVGWNMLDKQMTFSIADSTITISNTLFSFLQSGFKVGDSIAVNGAGANDGSYTISELTDSVITVDSALAADGVFSSVNIYGTSQINALNFYYNLIGGSDQISFRSLTDFEGTQLFTGEVLPTYYYYGSQFTLEPNSTSTAWWSNAVDGVDCKPVITYLGTDAQYRQQFSFVFPFLVTPFYRNGELQLLKNAYAQNSSAGLNSVDFIPPRYFFEQYLKPVFRIDGKFDLVSPEPDHSSFPQTNFPLGNSNWFDSFFPSGVSYEGALLTKAQFKFVSIAYTVNALPADQIDFNQVTDCTLVIQNINGGYDFASDPFVLNFCFLPVDAGKVQGYSAANQENLRTVFLHDRCKTSAGAPSANGDQFGGPTQALTDVTSVPVGNLLTINFKIDLGTLSKSVFDGANEADRNYLISVAPQGNGVAQLKHSNRTAVIADVNLATTNRDDATLLEVATPNKDVFFYKGDSASPKTDFQGFATDYGYAKCLFTVKKDCIIKNVNVSFVVSSSAVYSSETDVFPIEEWNNQTADYWNGKATAISITDFRGFDLPEGDIKNTRSIARKASLDTSSVFGYEIIYGFQLGYQFWQSLNEFPAQYLGYHTGYWPIYSQGKAQGGNYLLGDFSTQIYMKYLWDVYSIGTGITTTFEHYCDITCMDMNGNFGDFEVITNTQDIEGKDLSGDILMDAPTFIVAYFESKTGVYTIGAPGTVGEIVCYYENGNEIVFDRIKTDDAGPETSRSAWAAVPTIAYSAHAVSIRGQLDFSNFETKPKNLRLYAKIYY